MIDDKTEENNKGDQPDVLDDEDADDRADAAIAAARKMKADQENTQIDSQGA